MSLNTLRRKIKDKMYDPVEIKIREATSNDPWSATHTLLHEIARATHDYDVYQVRVVCLPFFTLEHTAAHPLHQNSRFCSALPLAATRSNTRV
jgi:hypothetical protein